MVLFTLRKAICDSHLCGVASEMTQTKCNKDIIMDAATPTTAPMSNDNDITNLEVSEQLVSPLLATTI